MDDRPAPDPAFERRRTDESTDPGDGIVGTTTGTDTGTGTGTGVDRVSAVGDRRPAVARAAIVVAGGQGSRLGGADKRGLVLGGRTLIRRTREALIATGHAPIVVVGPEVQGGPAAAIAAALPRLAAQGLPGAASGAEWVTVLAVDLVRPDLVLALLEGIGAPRPDAPARAADGTRRTSAEGTPTDARAAAATAGALSPGAAAGADPATDHHGDPGGRTGADGLVLADSGGRPQWLAAVYRLAALRDAVAGLDPAGASMRALTAGLDLDFPPADDDAIADIDTWEDYERAKELTNE